MKLGNITLKHGLMLAPMAGVTDKAFRKICRECGAEFTVSEMLSAKALCYEQVSKKAGFESKTAPLAALDCDEHPSAVQIFGSEPSFMAEAAAQLESLDYKGCTSQIRPAAIDINMGCPVHKIVSNGEGSALMKSPTLAADIVRAVKGALREIPVTVKIRAGFSNENKNAVEMAQAVAEAGASLICVHARTREQMYNPGIDLGIIASVKEAVNVPVVGNGDIYSAADALNMMKQTGCDGVMIARGARGNPWIFSEIAAALDGEEYIYPVFEDRMDTIIRQLHMMVDEKGERTAAAEAKKHVAWYIKGVRDAAGMRDRVMKSESTRELCDILLEIKSK
ncbi:MAG: tRNA dihydrouridine synthase DusB [Clostridia bacterium]|nr:tRNA dihydrouridine synthase DusB [Clostridia bacterium]